MVEALPLLLLIYFEKGLWYTWEGGLTEIIYIFKRHEMEIKGFKFTGSFYKSAEESGILTSIITNFSTW